MSNLRPAPAALTPQRVDALLSAIDAHDGVAQLRALGLAFFEINAIQRIAREMGARPLVVAVTMLRAALEAVEAGR